jgi:hypothetical protein
MVIVSNHLLLQVDGSNPNLKSKLPETARPIGKSNRLGELSLALIAILAGQQGGMTLGTAALALSVKAKGTAFRRLWNSLGLCLSPARVGLCSGPHLITPHLIWPSYDTD